MSTRTIALKNGSTVTVEETSTARVIGHYTDQSNAKRAQKRHSDDVTGSDSPDRIMHEVAKRFSDDGETAVWLLWEHTSEGQKAGEPAPGTPALDLPVDERIRQGLRGNLALDAESGVLVVDPKPEPVPDTADPVATVIAEEKAKARKSKGKKAETAAPETTDPGTEPTIPADAVEVGRKVRCGAGSVTYTHKKFDGKKFVFGRWTGEPDGSPVVTFAAGSGWWKDGRHLDGVSTIAGAFEAA